MQRVPTDQAGALSYQSGQTPCSPPPLLAPPLRNASSLTTRKPFRFSSFHLPIINTFYSSGMHLIRHRAGWQRHCNATASATERNPAGRRPSLVALADTSALIVANGEKCDGTSAQLQHCGSPRKLHHFS